ncbi:hypothetical protein pb186bvf_015763 [Paramecium bursaria]
MQTFSQIITNVRQYQIAENQQLGQGVYGIVCKAWGNLIPDKQICAKIIPINNTDNERRINELGNMVSMNQIKHRNLMPLQLMMENAILQWNSNNPICEEIFIERKEKNNWYTFDEVARLIRDLLYGLFELHNNNIIHRDLKPSNILIGSDFMINDFRICKKLDDVKKKNLQSICKIFLPLNLRKVYQQSNYTIKSDIYSLGVILYQLAFGGSFPWQQNIEKSYLEKLIKGNFKVKQPQLQAEQPKLEEIRLLIEKMLNQIYFQLIQYIYISFRISYGDPIQSCYFHQFMNIIFIQANTEFKYYNLEILGYNFSTLQVIINVQDHGSSTKSRSLDNIKLQIPPTKIILNLIHNQFAFLLEESKNIRGLVFIVQWVKKQKACTNYDTKNDNLRFKDNLYNLGIFKIIKLLIIK